MVYVCVDMSVYVGVHTQTPSASSSFPESSIHGTSALTSLSSRSWKVGLSLEGTYKSSIRDFQEYTFSYSMDGFLLLHGSGCRVSKSTAVPEPSSLISAAAAWRISKTFPLCGQRLGFRVQGLESRLVLG